MKINQKWRCILHNPYKYIAIEGNIGSGKTSLASRISDDYNAKLILEQFEDNSFLPKFYEDQARYAFPLELSFLAERYQQLKVLLSNQDLFKDFTISDYFINKSLIFSRKTLQSEEYKLYHKLFEIISQMIPQPDLLVYLYSSVERLQANIKKRDRSYEQNIENDYLEGIQQSYFDFIKHQKKLRIIIIDTTDLDFVNKLEDYQKITKAIFQDYSFGVHRIKF
ncbi:MAG: deoxynucleoside kinase [Bacteroidales bacterium]|nr:deoxynucleoside kinase [Bacteroidales bacterium]